MEAKLLPVIFAAIGLTVGCKALDQFPKPKDRVYDELKQLDKAYNEVIWKMYCDNGEEQTVGDRKEQTVGDRKEQTVGDRKEQTVGDRKEQTVGDRKEQTVSIIKGCKKNNKSEEERMNIRNAFIEMRLAVIDVRFQDWIRELAGEDAYFSIGVDYAEIGIGGIGTLATGGVSQVLSAISTGLASAQSSYSATALHDQTIVALAAQMHANREDIAKNRIFKRWHFDTMKYPLWVARQDLEAYQFAGSLPGAIAATLSDAQSKAEQVKRDDLALTNASRRFEWHMNLHIKVKGLSRDQALKLLKTIYDEFPQYSTRITKLFGGSDDDENVVRKKLRRLIIWSVTDDEDYARWRLLIGEIISPNH